MNFLDILGDIGAGFSEANTNAQKAYRDINTTRRDDITTGRQQLQYDADQEYDLFNATAGAGRAQQDLLTGQRGLALDRVLDQRDYFNPDTRVAVGKLANEFGADTPEFNRALGEYYTGRGMMAEAAPQFQTARREEMAIQQTTAAIRKLPGYENVAEVRYGEDANGVRRLFAFVDGPPDENGEFEVLEVPESAGRLFSSMMGDTRPLGYAQALQQADIQNRAAAAGQFGQPNRTATSRPGQPTSTGAKPATAPQLRTLDNQITQTAKRLLQTPSESGEPMAPEKAQAIATLMQISAAQRQGFALPEQYMAAARALVNSQLSAAEVSEVRNYTGNMAKVPTSSTPTRPPVGQAVQNFTGARKLPAQTQSPVQSYTVDDPTIFAPYIAP